MARFIEVLTKSFFARSAKPGPEGERSNKSLVRPMVLAIALAALATAVGAAAAQESPVSSSSPSPSNADVLRDVLHKMRTGQKIEPTDFRALVKAQNDGPTTGPEVGAKVPDFGLSDANGKHWTLGQLMGPKGLLLVFTRSADW